MSSLTVTTLSKSFGDLQILDDLSFTVSSGEALCITGPSGCGKSTLLHILGTLDRPSSGEVAIDGVDPFSLSEPELARFRNRTIGFVFQDAYLLPQYSLIENVLIPVRAFDKVTDDHRDRARGLIERVGLSERADHKPGALSGGERQRAALARALIYSPAILLCDEPTGSLDPKMAGTVADLLFDLHASRDGILVAVTHSAVLAGRFGRQLELGAPRS
jgi:lipoprotein-releasing system ATP-binding protein